MPIACSDIFKQTEAQSARAVKSAVSLVLGNYCTDALTTVSSSGDFSTDYPAAGVIDGDRTELNIGSYASAENGIGKSSWRSSTIPDLSQPTWLIINFNTARNINRVKVYPLSGHEIKSFTLEYWDGAAWHNIAVYINQGYGLDPYGTSPYGSPTNLPIHNFPTVTTGKIRITVTSTVVPNDYANIVEVEAYRVVDISSRVTAWAIQRDRDFKLKQDMASSARVDCSNTDRYFSPEYTPTAAEVTAGFINPELRSQLGVEISAGFEWSGSQVELLPQFTGFIDKISCQSKTRIATIEARDGMKPLLTTNVSTLLKRAISIESAIGYVLNLCNISLYDCSLDTSKLTIPFFFASSSAKTIIDSLIEASGDGQFYFDELGMAVYKQNTPAIPNNILWSQTTALQPGQMGWDEYSTANNVSTTRQPDEITIEWPNIDGWADGNYTSNPVWTTLDGDFNHLAIVSGGWIESLTSDSIKSIYLPLEFKNGQFEYKVYSETYSASDHNMTFFSFFTGLPTGAAVPAWNITGDGYTLRIWNEQNIQRNIILTRFTAGNYLGTVIASAILPASNTTDDVKLTISLNGWFNVYFNGAKVITVQDSTFTDFKYLLVGIKNTTLGVAKMSNIFYSSTVRDTAAAYDHVITPVEWVSPAIDLGADIVSLGILEATILDETNCTPIFKTHTSDDGYSWGDYDFVQPNTQIISTPKQWLQIKISYSSMAYNFGVFPTPAVKDMVVNWVRAGSVNKYPTTASRSISYDSSLIDVSSETTDELGGDSSILNNISVVGTPYNLSGLETDTAWEYLSGASSSEISAENPLYLPAGDFIITADIPGGMDTNMMTGINPAALSVSYGTAQGSGAITTISPTAPVIKLAITQAGTITGLKLIGKTFNTAVRNFTSKINNPASIKKYGIRATSISNSWILNTGVAGIISTALLANYKDETKLLSGVSTALQPSAQIGDRVTVNDINTAISADYWVVGIQHFFSSSQIYTIFKLWRIP